jgi:hypothetical protein
MKSLRDKNRRPTHPGAIAGVENDANRIRPADRCKQVERVRLAARKASALARDGGANCHIAENHARKLAQNAGSLELMGGRPRSEKTTRGQAAQQGAVDGKLVG